MVDDGRTDGRRTTDVRRTDGRTDGRTTEHGYTISSPCEPDGSGELTISKLKRLKLNQRTIGPENAHLKPDLGVLSHHEMTLTLNTHTPSHLY